MIGSGFQEEELGNGNVSRTLPAYLLMKMVIRFQDRRWAELVEHFWDFRVLPDRGPAPEWVWLWPAVVCGFLSLCRKNFTTRVQVTDYSLKLGTVKQGRA